MSKNSIRNKIHLPDIRFAFSFSWKGTSAQHLITFPFLLRISQSGSGGRDCTWRVSQTGSRPYTLQWVTYTGMCECCLWPGTWAAIILCWVVYLICLFAQICAKYSIMNSLPQLSNIPLVNQSASSNQHIFIKTFLLMSSASYLPQYCYCS